MNISISKNWSMYKQYTTNYVSSKFQRNRKNVDLHCKYLKKNQESH